MGISALPPSFILKHFRNRFQSTALTMTKMSISDLKTLCASSKASALAAMSAANLSGDRARAMDFYLGHMREDMPAEPGRSEAVSTDVADVIEGLMPELMDIFAGSDEVVKFEPVGPDDEEPAQQETVASVILRTVLHSFSLSK
jgi:hypothetical protein